MNQQYNNFIATLQPWTADVLRQEPEDGLNWSVFIYGTLMRRHANHWLLKGLEDAGHASYWGKGEADNTIVMDLGNRGLPALQVVRDSPVATKTVGELWNMSESAFGVLKKFEGNGYFYQTRRIMAKKTINIRGDLNKARQRRPYWVFGGPFVDWTTHPRPMFYGRRWEDDCLVSDYSLAQTRALADPMVGAKIQAVHADNKVELNWAIDIEELFQ